MSDLIERLRELAASEEVADRAADELERLTKLNSQKNADIGDWAEKYAEKCNEAAALKRENEELREELAALKASTEQWSHTMRQKKEWADEKDAEPDKYLSELHGLPVYLAPPTALLESLGDWVHERMQQADADYHDHGDDTAEVYATLKMVLSKIESMMIESLPLIEGEKE